MPGPGYLEMLQTSTLAKPQRAAKKDEQKIFSLKKNITPLRSSRLCERKNN
jgi:hypothetical protein